MASANVELVRSIYEPWERGDWSSVEWAHPDVTINVWENFRIEVDEDRELDEAHVLVLYRFGGRGKTSGLDVGKMQAKGAYLFRLSAGRVVRFVIYWDRDRAFADLGIDPEAGSRVS
jgi:hypothetical protein